jgi:capsular polysaccharide export protein
VLEHANEVAAKVATPSLLAMVDAVHTRTSLIGFEALLRGREVIAHGQPFYSGWGLTRDLAPLDRRRRRLSLAELVAGALILYPRYVDPRTGVLCPPEVLVARLAERRGRGIALIPWLMSLQGRARGLAGQLRPAI